jgi:exonuclease III
MDTTDATNYLTIAYLNIHGQSGLNLSKQKQIQDFLKNNFIDILHCQEINIEEDSFSQCNLISSSYNIIQNNSLNKYGTATFIRSDFNAENIKMDTQGRAIFFTIEKMTFGNLYLHSGTDAQSRGNREQFISETVPQLMTN